MRTKSDIAITNNIREYTEKRFQYFGGEVDWIECIPSLLGDMIEPIDALAHSFSRLSGACNKFNRISHSHDITKSNFGYE